MGFKEPHGAALMSLRTIVVAFNSRFLKVK
jgi:hypothetical protein